MIIYKDLFGGNELISDSFNLKFDESQLCYEFKAKKTSQKDNIDESKFGANASAEEVAEENETAAVEDFDFVIVCRSEKLHEIFNDKKSCKEYFKSYGSRLKKKLGDEGFDKIKKELTKFAQYYISPETDPSEFYGNLDFYGASEDYTGEGTLLILEWDNDDPSGLSAKVRVFAGGLVEEKC